LDGTVDVAEYLGADIFLIVDCGAAGKLTVRTDGESALRPGDPVGLVFADEKRHFFGVDGLAIR
jgi:multiple sugar transport system ATP-binding protein